MRRAPTAAPWMMCALIVPMWLASPPISQKYGFSPPAVAHADSPARSDPTRCIQYDQHVEFNGLRMRFESRCREAMSCTVRWTLRCEGERQRQPERRNLSLPVGEHRDITASAATCGDDRGWDIREISWRCHTQAP
jgi:hypothetical protein